MFFLWYLEHVEHNVLKLCTHTWPEDNISGSMFALLHPKVGAVDKSQHFSALGSWYYDLSTFEENSMVVGDFITVVPEWASSR